MPVLKLMMLNTQTKTSLWNNRLTALILSASVVSINHLVIPFGLMTLLTFPNTAKANVEDVSELIRAGLAKREERKYKEAINLFSRAIIINPNHSEAYYHRGFTKNYLPPDGDIKGTLEDYSKAIEIEPYYFKAYKSRGQLYYSLGNARKALPDLKKAAEYYTDDDFIFSLIGHIQKDKKDYVGALASFNKAISNSKSPFSQYYEWRAEVKMRLAVMKSAGITNMVPAIDDYEKSLAILERSSISSKIEKHRQKSLYDWISILKLQRGSFDKQGACEAKMNLGKLELELILTEAVKEETRIYCFDIINS